MPRGRTRYARPSGGTASGLWEAGSRLLTRCSRCRRIFSTPQRSSQPRAGLLPCDPIRPLRPLSALNSPLTWPTLGPRWGYAGVTLEARWTGCWTVAVARHGGRAQGVPGGRSLTVAPGPSPDCPKLGAQVRCVRRWETRTLLGLNHASPSVLIRNHRPGRRPARVRIATDTDRSLIRAGTR